MKKFISLLMILCMCSAAFIACTTDGNTDATTPAGEDVTTPTEDVTSTAITGDMTKGDLQGETVKILAWSDAGNLEFE